MKQENEFLRQFFSDENLGSYAKSAIEIAIDIPSKDIDTILIPSRGAFPIFLGVLYALELVSNEEKPYRDFFEGIRIPAFVKECYPTYKPQNENCVGNDVNVLVIPFTGDINIRDDYKEKCIKQEDVVDNTRKFWSNVAYSFLKEKEERERDPYFQTYMFLLKQIEKREKLAEEYENFPKAKRIAMIDTVISGRASSTILKEFDEISKKNNCEIPSHTFLILDSCGKRLKHPYSQYLSLKETLGLASFYQIPVILSEDKGATLEGVISIVYPDLMCLSMDTKTSEQLKKYVPFFGAGSWYPIPSHETTKAYAETFNIFMSLVKEYVKKEAKKEYGIGIISDNKDIENFRKRLIENIIENNLLNHNKPFDIGLFGHETLYRPDSIYETSSHVIHAKYKPGIARNILVKLTNYLSNTCI
jgi:hypothetical protein